MSTLAVEAGGGVGGTWYWNRYPGARCDVESIDYSYSFDPDLEQSWRWSERYATQPEIRAYADHVADRYALREHLRLNTRVTALRYHPESAAWTATMTGGDDTYEVQSRFVVLATGSLSIPLTPDIPGLADFAGTVLYTADWPEAGADLSGQRVGIMGTGSSGIQSLPILAEQAGHVTVFQRSPNYSVPAFNRQISDEEWQQVLAGYRDRRAISSYSGAGTPHDTVNDNALTMEPALVREALENRWRDGGVLFGKTFYNQALNKEVNDLARQFAEEKIRSVINDPAVADDLIPTDHPLGTKRICTDSGYFQAYNRDNVTLVNLRRDPIVTITPDGVRTESGDHPLDVLVFATGFDAMTGAIMRIDIVGADGVRVQDVWADGPLTYLGMAVPGLPNLFAVNGPGSPSVLANMVLSAEQQVEWLTDLFTYCRAHEIDEVACRDDAAVTWTEHVDQVASATLFVQANSWYLGSNVEGKKRVFMPYIGGFGNYRTRCDQVAAHGYEGFVLTRMGGRV